MITVIVQEQGMSNIISILEFFTNRQPRCDNQRPCAHCISRSLNCKDTREKKKRGKTPKNQNQNQLTQLQAKPHNSLRSEYKSFAAPMLDTRTIESIIQHTTHTTAPSVTAQNESSSMGNITVNPSIQQNVRMFTTAPVTLLIKNWLESASF